MVTSVALSAHGSAQVEDVHCRFFAGHGCSELILLAPCSLLFLCVIDDCVGDGRRSAIMRKLTKVRKCTFEERDCVKEKTTEMKARSVLAL